MSCGISGPSLAQPQARAIAIAGAREHRFAPCPDPYQSLGQHRKFLPALAKSTLLVENEISVQPINSMFLQQLIKKSASGT